MICYTIYESDQFNLDVEETAVWILESNIEQSENLALTKVEEFSAELKGLRDRLRSYPESGETAEFDGVRKFPIYEGRYSARWVVDHRSRTVTLLSLADMKHPKTMREFKLK